MELQLRLKKFIETKGLSQRQFEFACNMSNGAFKGLTKKMQLQTLLKIIYKFPELNIHWLITGEGPMIIEKSNGFGYYNR